MLGNQVANRGQLSIHEGPLVSVITRTRNRPLLLSRALDSVSGQYLRDLEWILVNDGGSTYSVDEVAADAERRGLVTKVIHKSDSTGMEAASNAGLDEATGRYFVIHDDDDSWDPGFLDAAVKLLEEREEFVGVVTQSIQVNEAIQNGVVIEVDRHPYNPGLVALSLGQMSLRNHFPPISFLVRRRILEEVGSFDESLPVLGDWDFALRVLLAGDIAVLRLPLANYHIRPKSTTSSYANSLSAALNDHAQYDALIRNRLIRRDLADGKVGIGFLLTLAGIQNYKSGEIEAIVRKIDMAPGTVESMGYVANQLADIQDRLGGTTASLENLLESVRSTLRRMPLLRSVVLRQESAGVSTENH